MKRLVSALVVLLTIACAAQAPQVSPEMAAWRARAQGITITRDNWGIAHVHGKTDADAVFGMVYAQAEDDFNRVEQNFLVSLGRLSQADGEKEVYRDLRQRLFIDDGELKAQYAAAPDWLRALMDGWADGLNYYLATHPAVKPRAIARFEPWMALSFSEGSIGGDIERVNLAQLESFYGGAAPPVASADPMPALVEPTGSNGFAIAPSNTASGKALLWINPHTSFFFRSELQMTSDEGLNAYGAVTWGQFFVYQGFNERAGWMHTSSGVDNIDEFLETVTKKPDGVYYQYGAEERKVSEKKIVIQYKTPGGMAAREFTTYRTHHGPVVREAEGRWVAFRIMEEPLKALQQSYSRTKAHNYKEYKDVMELHTNSSNNTVFADSEGNIAYFHSNFIPRRDTRFDYTKPVDGSDPATDWGPPLGVDETPNELNPKNGWIQNTNNWPFSVSGSESPKQKDYPRYVENGGENPRGVHAMKVLDGRKDFTRDSLIAAAFDSFQPEFAVQVPLLVRDYDRLPASSALKAKLADQVKALRGWDFRWGVGSVENSLATYWGEDLWQRVTPSARKAGMTTYDYMRTTATAEERLASLSAASDRLTADFGKWNTPWGDINRYQRLTADIVQQFRDDAPSIPVGFASSRWGSLAAFGARTYPGTKRMYGTSGNSFLAAVEFGDRVKARAITAGGESGDPASPHFGDQAERYAKGDLRDVYFYPDELQGHIERQYHPGDSPAPATK